MIFNYNIYVLGAVAQLGERLDGIQKVVGSIPSSSTILRICFISVFTILFYLNKIVLANSRDKLLIPNEIYKNETENMRY